MKISGKPRSAAPEVTGHRGAGAERPENTLAGFQYAADIGCDRIELDVHLSRDGVPVVVHDALIELPGGASAELRSLTVEEICSVRVGGDECVPRLSDVLELLAPTKLDIQIELKGEGVIEATTNEVRRFALERRVIFTSFYHRRVLEARRLLPAVRTGVLLGSVPIDIADVARRAGAGTVHLQHTRLSDEVVSEIHAADMTVAAWGVIKEDAQFDRLFELGVDIIGSDWPSRLLARRARFFGAA